MQRESGETWPVVARDMELRRALAALGDAEFQGVALVGDSGVGKSTLARILAKTAESAGQTVRFVLGTHTGRAVPLGAFSRAVTLDAVNEPAIMLAAAHKTLAKNDKLVVVVDDAQLLDPLSATLVHQLAASGRARLIVTIRSGESILDAVTALMKERLLVTVHVDPLTREQAEVLAGAVLGGSVESRLVDELYERSAGNLLLMRSLLSASLEKKVLVRAGDRWQLRGPLRADRELCDLLEFRLDTLAPEELDVVEVLATAEVLEWEILREICDTDAAAKLERGGLIQLVADGSHTLAQLNHPVLGDVATRRAGIVRSRQLNGKLAQAFGNHLEERGRDARSPDVRGRIRLARFMVRSDLTPDLGVIIAAAADAVAMSNVALGEELARFAVDRGAGLEAVIVFAKALSWQGRGDEAEAELADADLDGSTEWLIAQWGCLRTANLFWVCRRVEAAQRVLADVKNRVTSEASIRLANALDVSIRFCLGDVAGTLKTGPSLCESDLMPVATVWAAVATASALAVAGRFAEVSRVTETALRAAVPSGVGLQRLNIGMAEVMGATAAGDLLAADRLCKRYAAMAAGVPQAEAHVQAMLGLLRLASGALPSASAALEAAESPLRQGYPSPWLILVAARHAQAEGARGDSEAAAAALSTAENAYGPHVAVFLPELQLARAWQRASAGETKEAQGNAMQAAHNAQRAGMYAVEMRALHTAARFGDRSHSTRLAELASILRTPFANAVADHARGLFEQDAGLLGAAARRFSELGAQALAADAAAQAAGEHARQGDRNNTFELTIWACSVANKCGLNTPAVNSVARPLPLSGREREISTLVAAGLSNRQIAEKLVVSVRTVEGHLYRLFAKVHINNRDQLIDLMSRQPTGRNRSLIRCDKDAADEALDHKRAD
ncbi:LuxR family transcriptional regulator [Mycobacterium sp. 852002-51057_SCH5723018]|nr:LuxR family transcriptional regulator [Mycobacterium sp. 852002-51057_SCH5723018]